MKAIRFAGPEKIAHLDVSDPQAGPGEVVIRVQASALCAADLDPYHGRQHAGVGSSGHGPVIPGHEGAGVVESIAPDVRSVKVGDRVAAYTFVGCNNCRECRSGFWMLCREAQCLGFDRDGPDAELLVVPARNCLKLPDWMDYVEGSLMTDLFGTTYTAAKRIRVSARDTVAIFGMGPIGVCEVAICKALGAEVIGVDVVDDRLAAAKKGFACDHTVNSAAEDPVLAIRAITGGEGATRAIDCSGNARAEADSLNCVSLHGTVAFVGWGSRVEIEPARQVITKDITIRGSWCFNTADFEEIIRFVKTKRIPLASLVTHRFPLQDASEAFSLFDAKKTLKTVLLP